jgi:hypothetical protein
VSPVREFWWFFVAQCLNYSLNDMCARWIAQGNIPLSVSSAMVFAVVSFTLMKRLLKREVVGKFALAGYVCGGGLGTFLGVVISKQVTGI